MCRLTPLPTHARVAGPTVASPLNQQDVYRHNTVQVLFLDLRFLRYDLQ